MNPNRLGSIVFLFLLVVLASRSAPGQSFPTTGPSRKAINLVCIGDSITAGAGMKDAERNCAPAVLAGELSRGLPAGTTVYLLNTGRSGATTEDWVPPKGMLASASFVKHVESLIAAHSDGQLIFSIMLGTNDSANSGPHGSPISAARYAENMSLMTLSLIAAHPNCLIFIHHPIFYSKTTHNSSDYEGDSAHDRLQSYMPIIDAIVEGDAKNTLRHIYPGDADAYDHFVQHCETECRPEQGKNGTFYLHPNEKGAAELGKYWAAAILKQIK